MKNKRTKPQRKSLHGRIADEAQMHRKVHLAWHGNKAFERDTPAARIARDWFWIRNTKPESLRTVKGNPDIYEMRFNAALKRLAGFTNEALAAWRPQDLEELAAAMRATERGEFDSQPDEAALSILGDEAGGNPNTARLAAALTPPHGEPSNTERSLRRIRKRILPQRKA